MPVITDTIIGGIAWEAFSRSVAFYNEEINDFVLRVYIAGQLRALEQLEEVSQQDIEEIAKMIEAIIVEIPEKIKKIGDGIKQKKAFEAYIEKNPRVQNIVKGNLYSVGIVEKAFTRISMSMIDSSTDTTVFNRDSNVSIDSDNNGNIITGDHNTIISDSSIDYESKLKEILHSLPIGNILFNAPKEIHYGESKSVTLRISKKNISSEDLPIENQQIEKEVKISSFMSAKLMSDDFKIRTWSNEEQLIDESTFTEWKWNIFPNTTKKNGKLYLRITIRIPLKSHQDEKKDLPIFEKSIDILVN